MPSVDLRLCCPCGRAAALSRAAVVSWAMGACAMLCYGRAVLTGCTALIEDESAHELCGVNAMLPIDYHRNMAVLCVRIRAGVAGHGGGVVASAARAWSARARARPRPKAARAFFCLRCTFSFLIKGELRVFVPFTLRKAQFLTHTSPL